MDLRSIILTRVVPLVLLDNSGATSLSCVMFEIHVFKYSVEDVQFPWLLLEISSTALYDTVLNWNWYIVAA